MVLLASGALLVAPGLLRDMDLRIAVLLTALSAAAFIASLITNRRLVRSSRRTAINVVAWLGLLLDTFTFGAIYLSYWLKSNGG